MTAYSDKAHELIPFAIGQLFPCKTLLKHLETSRNPRRALGKFLTETAGQATELHNLYGRILNDVSEDDKYIQDVILVIILVTSDKRPLSPEAILYFLQRDSRFADESLKSILSLIQPLRAVLHDVYEEKGSRTPLRVRHSSFLEYLSQKPDSGFCVNLSEIHELMAIGCLATMHEELKFKICCLKDSYRLNEDVQDLEEQISKHISEVLQYASFFWLAHVSELDLEKEHGEVIWSISLLITSPKIQGG